MSVLVAVTSTAVIIIASNRRLGEGVRQDRVVRIRPVQREGCVDEALRGVSAPVQVVSHQAVPLAFGHLTHTERGQGGVLVSL